MSDANTVDRAARARRIQLSAREIDAVAARHPEAIRPNRLKTASIWAIAALLVGYFVYLYDAFDIRTMIDRADPQRAQLYALDLYSHKIEGRADLRKPEEGLIFRIEGSRFSEYETPPDWVAVSGPERARAYQIDLGPDGSAYVEPGLLVVTLADGREIRIQTANGARENPVLLSDPLPWMRVAENKIEGMFPSLRSRFRVTATRLDVTRVFNGWENFWFDFGNPLQEKTVGELVGLVFSSDRLDPDQSNASYIFDSFWSNSEWQHGEVFYALFLTVLMALLGTMLASIFGLPLAFIAARNVNPVRAIPLTGRSFVGFGLFAFTFTTLNVAFARYAAPTLGVELSPVLSGVLALLIGGVIALFFLRRSVSAFVALIIFTLAFSLLYAVSLYLYGYVLDDPMRVVAAFATSFLLSWLLQAAAPLQVVVKKLFDILRGIDMLIWSLIFIRAFGLGPLSGVLAIFFTDTGTLGKLFSEAIENADKRQVEGVQATGADAVQRNFFGIVPQILPVFISQSLYFLESNTRSATVIGILGAGGIGLKLAETIRTRNDWENTLYMIVLIIIVVILMDNFSGWARTRLIHGRDPSLEKFMRRQGDAARERVAV